MVAAPGIEVDGLTIRYGQVVAVDGVSFAAPAGQVTGVVGPNGAGKTSTLETLEGFRVPVAGRVSVLGLDPRADQRVLAGRMGVMLQEVGIHPAVRVEEALHHMAALYPDARPPGELISRLGLDGLERRPFRRLSGGEQRRLALALALVGRPQVVFLDEPTAGVDPSGRLVIRELVAELRDQGVTVVLSSHELDEVERMAQRVVLLDRGRLVAEGTLAALTSQGEQVRFGAPPGLDTGALSAALGPTVEEVAPGRYVVSGESTPRLVAGLTAWLAERDVVVADLSAGHESLEEVFLRLTATPLEVDQ